MVVDW